MTTTLADGAVLPTWDDSTAYDRVYHVSQAGRGASDTNPGTLERPFASIGRAAELLEPGGKVVIHAGIYRETVSPARGGDSSSRMIAFEAAPGELVTVTGADVWRPQWRRSEGWRAPDGIESTRHPVMMADLPAGCFGDYNPFRIRNAYLYLDQYGLKSNPEWLGRVLAYRGSVLVDGAPVRQVLRYRDLFAHERAFWVDETEPCIHLRGEPGLFGGAPVFQITVRESVFRPRTAGLGFIRVSGLRLTHAANGLPVPQIGLLSANRGHHWIVEDAVIEDANGVGLDIGLPSWDANPVGETGSHVIRRNAIRRCGVCGIAGAGGVTRTLIEDNLIEEIGFHDLERMYECAAIKFHFCEDTLVRRNIVRRIEHACGIWLDVRNVNCRVTGNLFHDITTAMGCVYSEMNFGRNLVDHNVIWGVRAPQASPDRASDRADHPYGVRADCNEELTVAHNLFGEIEGPAVAFTLLQSGRRVDGRTGVCRANCSVNNVFHRSPRRLELGRLEENRSDGNLYDRAPHGGEFAITHPQPGTVQSLDGFRTWFDQDRASCDADFEIDLSATDLSIGARLPAAPPTGVAWAHPDATEEPVCGPFSADEWRRITRGERVRLAVGPPESRAGRCA